MWTRHELKTRAKQALKRYFWAAFAVSLLFAIASGKIGGANTGAAGAGVNAGVNAGGQYEAELAEGMLTNPEAILENLPQMAGSLIGGVDSAVTMTVLLVLLVGFAISLALGIFVTPIIEVGRNRFYMESRAIGYAAGFEELIWGFKNGYLKIVWTMFLKHLFVTAGTICCVIPGIYLAYAYCMVPYILAENPKMKTLDVLRLSADMMKGNKFRTFILEISFFGWWIVGAMACGIGTLFVLPYYDATFAELYAVLRQPFSQYLNGFGMQNGGSGNGYYQDPNGGYYDDRRNRQDDYDRERDYGYRPEAGQDPWQNRSQQPWQNQPQDPWQNQPQQPWQNQPQDPWQNQPQQPQEPVQCPVHDPSGNASVRPEGEKVRGYYLNGVFYPYTDEELRELENNKHKN